MTKKLIFWFNLLKVKTGMMRLPLFVSWSLTNRCPYKCQYCSNWKMICQELTLPEIFAIIDDLARSGTRYVSFTGGEPFLKEGIADILNKATKKGMVVNLNSSGFGVKENKETLKNIKSLTLTFDGPKDIHNYVRGDEAAYDRVVGAILEAKKAGLKVRLYTVLGKHNKDHIDAILQAANKFNCFVTFQPATSIKLRGQEKNNMVLSEKESFDVLKYLIYKKKEGFKVANSLAGLQSLREQLFRPSRECWGGRPFFGSNQMEGWGFVLG